MPISKEDLRHMLTSKFPDADLEIIALANDGDHYEVRIASAQFQGLNMLGQHRLVNQALQGIVGTTLHALSIKTSVK
jgi:stress-induced morphogen